MTRKLITLCITIISCVFVVGCDPAGDTEPRQQSTSASTGRLGRDNVLLITLDTTRADRIGCYGYEKAATPTLDAIAASGTVFDQAFAQVPLTLPSHTSILTGRYPREHGIRNNNEGGLSPDLPSLATAFQAHGHETGAFIAAFVLDSHYGLDRGFDVYEDDMESSKIGVQPAEWQNRGDVVTDRALAWLDTVKDKPFFAWVHYYDPHEPYAPPAQFAERFEDPYDGEIAFMDTQIKRLTDWLASAGANDRTLIVVVGDHGESFRAEHGEQGHSIFLYNTNIHVPLIIKHPRLAGSGTRVPAIVEALDVFPTVMELFGLSLPDGLLSRSLAGALAGKELDDIASYSESHFGKDSFNWAEQRSLTTPRWKYISSAVPELFDRRADPLEKRNVHDLQPDVAVGMLEALKARFSEMKPGEAASVPQTSKAEAALRSLGYLPGKNPFVPASTEFLTPGLDDPKKKLILLDRLKAGMQAVRQREYDMGISLLSSVVEECPYAAAAYTSLGIAYLQSGQPGRAEEVLDVLLDKDRENYAANVTMGDVQMELQRPEQAILRYTVALAGDLPYADVYAKLGVAQRQVNRNAEAVSSFRKALDLMPVFPEAHFELATTLSKQGDVAGAIRHYQLTLEQQPKYAIAHYNLGLELVKVSRFEEAAKQFQTAVELQPQYADALINLAIVLTRLGRLDESKEVLARAQGIASVSCKSLYLLGVVFAQGGQVDRTVELYEQALTCEPFDASPVTELANYYISIKKPGEALRVLRIGFEKAPDNVQILLMLAEFLATSSDDSLRDGPGAVRVAERAGELAAPKNPRVLRVLAAALAESRLFEPALATAEQALAIAEAGSKRELVRQLREDMSQYRQNRPVRSARY